MSDCHEHGGKRPCRHCETETLRQAGEEVESLAAEVSRLRAERDDFKSERDEARENSKRLVRDLALEEGAATEAIGSESDRLGTVQRYRKYIREYRAERDEARKLVSSMAGDCAASDARCARMGEALRRARDFVRAIYSFRWTEGRDAPEPDDLIFGTVDYYEMESLTADIDAALAQDDGSPEAGDEPRPRVDGCGDAGCDGSCSVCTTREIAMFGKRTFPAMKVPNAVFDAITSKEARASCALDGETRTPRGPKIPLAWTEDGTLVVHNPAEAPAPDVPPIDGGDGQEGEA